MKIINWFFGLFASKQKVVYRYNEPVELDDAGMMRIIKKAEDEIVKAAFEIESNDPQKIVEHLITKNDAKMSDDAKQNLMVYATLTMGRARELFAS